MEISRTIERVLQPVVIAGLGIAVLAGCAEDQRSGGVGIFEETTTTTAAPESTIQDSTTTTGVGGTLLKVVEVVDGDTVKLDFNSGPENVRIIGIDTPESVHPVQPVECFGREASDHAKELLEGQTVEFRIDSFKGEGRDVHDRPLGHIYFGGRNFGLQMIKDGYAYEFTFEGEDYDGQKEFIDAEKAASAAEVGLWAPDKCNGLQTPVEGGRTGDSANKDECEPNLIKGNKSENGQLYHEPDDPYYDRTTIDLDAGERCFNTAEEAEAAGWTHAGS